MKRNLGWLALLALLVLPAGLAWAGEDKAGAPDAGCCCCCQQSCPKG